MNMIIVSQIKQLEDRKCVLEVEHQAAIDEAEQAEKGIEEIEDALTQLRSLK